MEISDLENTLSNYIDECVKQRFEIDVPHYDASLVEIHSALVNTQMSMSKIERLLSNAMRAKAAMDRKLNQLRAEYQEKWDKAISNLNKRPTLGDFATGKEKAAEANLATFNDARNLRREEELQAFANEAVDVIRLHYYGLDKLRQDLRKRLDISQTEYFSTT